MRSTRARRWATVMLAGWLAWGCRPSSETQRDPRTTQDEPRRRRSEADGEEGTGRRWKPETTYAVISGVLSWQDPNLASFSTHHRKDAELHRVLAERGVPASHMRLLLDGEATRAGIEAALGEVAASAPPGSTLVFYYAGHGVKDDHGHVHFASYDLQTGDPAHTGLSLERVRDILSRRFDDGRILLLADCCFSGGLEDVARELSGDGVEALSLTSAEASNTSTANWTYSQTLLDALRGDPLADRDGDGWVTVAEMADEVADAMKFREHQRAGFFGGKAARRLRMARARGERPSRPDPSRSGRSGTPALGSYGLTERGGDTVTVRVLEVGKDKLRVRAFDYADADDFAVPPRRVKPITFERYAVGTDLSVYWGGKVWSARVLETDGDFHRITYPGWPSYWDEWVMSDRVASTGSPGPAAGDGAAANVPAPGAAVEVEWRGTWYPAVVLDRRGARALIHYEGYDASWDEWVPRERVRSR